MIRPNCKDAKKFATVLEKSRTLYISFGHEGLKVDENQVRKLRPEVVLGLRVAWAYWFEDIDPSSFLAAVMDLPDVEEFTLAKVLSMISNEKHVTCLHLVLDDYDLIPPSLERFKKEPYITTLNHALLESLNYSISIASKMFVFCTWSGTGCLDNRILLRHRSDSYSVTRVFLPPLTTDSVSSIIGQIWGDDWEKTVSPQLQKLAGFFGGLPKCAEALGAKTSFQNSIAQVSRRFESNVAFATLEAGLIPYLALSGCQVSANYLVGGLHNRDVAYFEHKGDVAYYWLHEFSMFGSEGVIGMPLMFVWHHLNSNFGPLPGLIKKLAEELKNGWDSMTFQQLSVLLLALRFNTAIALSRVNRTVYLGIDELFNDAYRHSSMSDMDFLCPIRNGIPVTHASINLFEQYMNLSKPQIIIATTSSDFNGVIITHDSTYNKYVMFWIDADNSMDTEILHVNEVLRKMDKIIELKKKMPEKAHILVIISTKSMGNNQEVKKLVEWPQKFHENVVLVNKQGQPYTIKLSKDQIEVAQRTLIICKENFHTAYSAVLAPLLLPRKEKK